MSVITLAQAKAHLRIDTPSGSPLDAADQDLLLKMAAAEDIVLDYLKVPASSPPLWDETTVPPLVQAAVLMQLGILYRFRGDDPGSIEQGPAVDNAGSLSPIIEGILRRYRDPALA